MHLAPHCSRDYVQEFLYPYLCFSFFDGLCLTFFLFFLHLFLNPWDISINTSFSMFGLNRFVTVETFIPTLFSLLLLKDIETENAFSLAVSWSFLYSHASCNPSCSNFYLILPRRAIGPSITLGTSSTVQVILIQKTDLRINLFPYQLIAEFVRICIYIFYFKVYFQGLLCSIDFHHC